MFLVVPIQIHLKIYQILIYKLLNQIVPVDILVHHKENKRQHDNKRKD